MKETPADTVPRLTMPRAAAPVEPTPCRYNRTMEAAVIAVVEIVADPPVSVTVPAELAPAVVVEATLE